VIDAHLADRVPDARRGARALRLHISVGDVAAGTPDFQH
jgi:hypothetical protein